jgi:hypothetical protein
MSQQLFQGHVGIGPRVTAEALVASDNFSARYDLDRIKGVFSRQSTNYAGKAMSVKSSFSTRPRAALPRRGCCEK